MKKKLITKNDIESMNIADGTIFHVEKHMILSPGAKDCLRKKEVKLEYTTSLLSEKEQKLGQQLKIGNSGGFENSSELEGAKKVENLEEKVKKILYDDYQIEDQYLVEVILGKIKN